MSKQLSVIIPALNEADGIIPTLERVKAVAQAQNWDLELIVVDDGSTDGTGDKAREAGATVIRHPTNGGYGLSLQDGIRAARHPFVAITDADGTYPIEELPKIYSMVVDQGYDMAVGARTGTEYKKGLLKYPARIMFRLLAEYVAGRRIADINSGLRVMRREKLLPHLSRTCLGFSFTTSITLIFFLNGFFVGYTPIPYAVRMGNSKVRHIKDTLRTTQIMVSVISHYNPLKLFLLIALVCLLAAFVLGFLGWLVGSVWLGWVSAGLIGSAPICFALGCLSENVRLGNRHES
jgi:glycosyltransferase involved in cell wall biosynthesis